MRILHIAPDEKFIDNAIYQFEQVIPNASDYIVFLNTLEDRLHFVKNTEKIEIKERTQLEIKNILSKEYNYDLICFHGIDSFQAKIILNLQSKTKVLWFLFGYEFYDNPMILNPKRILGNITYKQFYRQKLDVLIKESIRPVFSFLYNNSDSFSIVKKALRRSDYCGILYREEYDYIKNILELKELKYFKFSYYPIEYIVKNEIEIRSNNILIGNSATVTNNHLDIFEILKDLDLQGRNLIVPLSYGNVRYKKFILKKGEEFFFKKFQPLLHFLPLEEYNNYLSQCNVAIMGHHRQQAVGNIIVLLWLGVKVFLSEKSTLFSYLTRKGVVVYCLEKDLHASNKNVFLGLNKTEILKNREILYEEINQDILFRNLRAGLQNILNDK